MAIPATTFDLAALDDQPPRPLAIRVKNIAGQQVGHLVDIAGDHALVIWHHGRAADWCPRLLLRLASPPDVEAREPVARRCARGVREHHATSRPSRRDTPNPDQLTLDI